MTDPPPPDPGPAPGPGADDDDDNADTDTDADGGARRTRLALLSVTGLCVFLYAGAFFGWGPIQLMLEAGGAFSGRCGEGGGDGDGASSSCPAQTAALLNVQLVAQLTMVASPVLGAASDRYGGPAMVRFAALPPPPRPPAPPDAVPDAYAERRACETLGVAVGSEWGAIKTAYRKLALESHPDKLRQQLAAIKQTRQPAAAVPVTVAMANREQLRTASADEFAAFEEMASFPGECNPAYRVRSVSASCQNESMLLRTRGRFRAGRRLAINRANHRPACREITPVSALWKLSTPVWASKVLSQSPDRAVDRGRPESAARQAVTGGARGGAGRGGEVGARSQTSAGGFGGGGGGQ